MNAIILSFTLFFIIASCETYYETLGIDKSATADQIKVAYRKLAMKFHPDRNGPDSASTQEIFKKISEAHRVLSDPSARANYDQPNTRQDQQNRPRLAQHKRFKRDFGASVAASVVGALAYGIIGVTAQFLRDKYAHTNFHVTSGTCGWSGSLMCKGTCPSGFDSIRKATSKFVFEGVLDKTDDTFENDCWSGEQVYCCKGDTRDQTWGGEWTSGQTGSKLRCNYVLKEYKIEKNSDYCGDLVCEIDGAQTGCEIVGIGCNIVYLNGEVGVASPGFLNLGGVGFYKTN